MVNEPGLEPVKDLPSGGEGHQRDAEPGDQHAGGRRHPLIDRRSKRLQESVHRVDVKQKPELSGNDVRRIEDRRGVKPGLDRSLIEKPHISKEDVEGPQEHGDPHGETGQAEQRDGQPQQAERELGPDDEHVEEQRDEGKGEVEFYP